MEMIPYQPSVTPPTKEYKGLLLVRFLQDEDGRTTDVRRVANNTTYRCMGKGLKLLSQDADKLALVGELEFNSKNIRGTPDPHQLALSAKSISNLYWNSTYRLRFICVDLAVTTMGQFISSLVKLDNIYLYRSNTLGINKHQLKKLDLSEMIKVGHHVNHLCCEECDLNNSETFLTLVHVSLDPSETLHVTIKSPKISFTPNDMKALRRCVDLHINPKPRLSLTMDFHLLEHSIYSSKLRQQPIKDAVRDIMVPFYRHFKQGIIKMAKNEEKPVDEEKFVNLLSENQGSLTATFILLKSFPHMMEQVVGLVTPPRTGKANKKKRKQGKKGKRSTKRSKA